MNNFFKLYITILFLSYSFVAVPFFSPFRYAQTLERQAKLEERIKSLEASNKSLRESNNSIKNELMRLQERINDIKTNRNKTYEIYGIDCMILLALELKNRFFN